jgi:hypothetical protein
MEGKLVTYLHYQFLQNMMFIHSCVTMILEHTCHFHYCIQNCKHANITTKTKTAAAAATLIVMLTVKVTVMLVTYINQLFS